MEKELIGYFRFFELVDILGFARILEVEEKDDFEEFIESLVIEFLKKPRKIRRELLKLARDIAKNNKDFKKEN